MDLDPSRVKTAEDARRIIEAHPGPAVKLAVADLDGVLRGKYVSKEKALSAVDGGFGFCDVVLGWDVDDQLLDNVQFTGWHTGYPDANAHIVPDTCRDLPLEKGPDGRDGLFFLCEFTGEAEKICPRGVLRRVVERAQKMGYTPFAGVEYEFFVFDETPWSAQEKGYRNLKPFTPGSFGYSVIRSSVHSELHRELLDVAEAMRFPIEGLHTETGPGVLEAALSVSTALEAADRAALFKTFAKVIAQRRGLMATFMAKWSNQWPGQSGHIHVSLQDDKGHNTFFDENQPHRMSKTMRHFLAGQQRLLPELLCMISPTVNSYTRLIPGFWAPTSATWGVENRTCALRVIPGSKKSQRVEFRIAAADANPYLALAAAIGAGLYGIEHQLEPTEPIRGNAYEAEVPDELGFAATLYESAGRLRRSEAARDLFGEAFPPHFAASREWEERQFRKHVTDWELKRYFEII